MILRWQVVAALVTLVSCNRFETDAVKENIEKGHAKYNEFKDASRAGKAATCWAAAIEVFSRLIKITGEFLT